MIQGLQTALWERYVSERFGQDVLYAFRATSPTRRARYPQTDAEIIVDGLTQISALRNVPVNWLARDYGRFAMLTMLREKPHSYQNAREVLLLVNAPQSQGKGEGTISSFIGYKVMVTEPQGLLILYNEPQKLCALLTGIIEGAAARFGEQVIITERTCMQSGATTCRFDLRFQVSSQISLMPKPETSDHWQQQQQLDAIVFSILPASDGMRLSELRVQLEQATNIGPIRPLFILQALDHLMHEGRVMSSTKDRSSGAMSERRYWRVKQAQSSAWFGHGG